MAEAILLIAIGIGLAWYSGIPQKWLHAYVAKIVREVLDDRSQS